MKRVSYSTRLWSKVGRTDEPGACWMWRGARNKSHGYGMIWNNTAGPAGRSMLAHRAVYEDVYGPVPDGLLVCHHCDNPMCVNPGHLFLGTYQDNYNDMKAKGRNRHNLQRGDTHHLAKLTQSLALEVRYLYWNENRNMSEIARWYGVSTTAIVQVIKRISWNGDRFTPLPAAVTSIDLS